MVTISPLAKHKPRERHFEVPPCCLDDTQCTLKSRIEAKLKHSKGFHSVLKMGQPYFKQRGMSLTTEKLPMIRHNVESK